MMHQMRMSVRLSQPFIQKKGRERERERERRLQVDYALVTMRSLRCQLQLVLAARPHTRKRPEVFRGRRGRRVVRVFVKKTNGSSSSDLDGEGGREEEKEALYATDSKEYFKGMFTSTFKESDTQRDMVTPTVKLIGQASLVLAIFFLAFMKSNGLI